MPIVPKNPMPNMDLIRPKTKELLSYYCGCHGNLVTIATRHVADAYRPIEPPIPNLDSIRLKTKELQSKMYLTQTHRLRLIDCNTHIKTLCNLNATWDRLVFLLKKKT